MKLSIVCIGMIAVVNLSLGQVPIEFRQAQTMSTLQTTLLSNVINDIVVAGDTIWLATEKGVSYSPRGALSWTNLANTYTFDAKGISAIGVYGTTICVATGYTTTLGDANVVTGGGLHISTDHGRTWRYVPQPVDVGTIDTLFYGSNIIRTLAITVPQQNITYDIAVTSSTIWIASWAGMLRKSTDGGITWQRVVLPPDHLNEIDTSMTLKFDLSPVQKVFTINGIKDTLKENHNHKVFAVYATSESEIWVGTANGINRSTDGGISWRKYTHQNQAHPISGNFVVAIREQRWKNHRVLWAATNNAVDPSEYKAVSYSEDDGLTWKTALHGLFIHNIACRDSIVYVATNNGVYRSADIGKTWIKNGTIYDIRTHQQFTSDDIYCVGVTGDTVWVGSIDGLAYTFDTIEKPFGSEWHIIRRYDEIGTNRMTYAYPNPFSPDLEFIRIHYSTKGHSSTTVSVKIQIFNFALQPVRTLLWNATRTTGIEYDELWNGRDDRGHVVSNGVYFYSVSINNNTPVWGKILVVR
ncbi:MAG: hypothetical protein N3A63_00090 [Bacteroidetes bacterium]|nr:hypothetical protein [Bacteroidota bacterium]